MADSFLMPRKEQDMFTKLFGSNYDPSPPVRKEGDLYKVIELYGQKFEIRYGYYEDIDRQYEPYEVYPNFKKHPVYTDDGAPFVTLMQESCKYYKSVGNDSDHDCSSCVYMERGDELIAVCRCPYNRSGEQETDR